MKKIQLILGDITKIKADAIVNAANYTLLGGGGVDGAIHRAAGNGLLLECKKLRDTKYPEGFPTGEAVVTKAYNLPAKFIIHTVGPRYYKEDISLLKQCYLNCLKLAEKNNCESIAFPAISTGAYGCPIEKSAEIVKEVLDTFKSDIIQNIYLILYNKKDFDVYARIMKKHLLFVCTSAQDRSPCAANLFKNSDKYEAKFAGISPGSEVSLTKETITWADIIFTMEPMHQAYILERFRKEIWAGKKKVILLDVNNNFKRYDRALEEILVTKLREEGFLI